MLIRLCCWMGLAACIAGCSGDSSEGTTVTGTVTLDGQPLPRGQVIFEPDNTTGELIGGIAADGTYTVTGVPVGKVNAAVRTKMFDQINKAQEKFAMKGAGGKADKLTVVHVPPRYEAVRSANLSYTVSPNAVIDIKLTK